MTFWRKIKVAIVIMGCEAKDVPIKPNEIKFDKDGRSMIYVDSKGKRVKKMQIQASEYIFFNLSMDCAHLDSKMTTDGIYFNALLIFT